MEFFAELDKQKLLAKDLTKGITYDPVNNQPVKSAQDTEGSIHKIVHDENLMKTPLDMAISPDPNYTSLVSVYDNGEHKTLQIPTIIEVIGMLYSSETNLDIKDRLNEVSTTIINDIQYKIIWLRLLEKLPGGGRCHDKFVLYQKLLEDTVSYLKVRGLILYEYNQTKPLVAKYFTQRKLETAGGIIGGVVSVFTLGVGPLAGLDLIGKAISGLLSSTGGALLGRSIGAQTNLKETATWHDDAQRNLERGGLLFGGLAGLGLSVAGLVPHGSSLYGGYGLGEELTKNYNRVFNIPDIRNIETVEDMIAYVLSGRMDCNNATNQIKDIVSLIKNEQNNGPQENLKREARAKLQGRYTVVQSHLGREDFKPNTEFENHIRNNQDPGIYQIAYKLDQDGNISLADKRNIGLIDTVFPAITEDVIGESVLNVSEKKYDIKYFQKIDAYINTAKIIRQSLQPIQIIARDLEPVKVSFREKLSAELSVLENLFKIKDKDTNIASVESMITRCRSAIESNENLRDSYENIVQSLNEINKNRLVSGTYSSDSDIERYINNRNKLLSQPNCSDADKIKYNSEIKYLETRKSNISRCKKTIDENILKLPLNNNLRKSLNSQQDIQKSIQDFEAEVIKTGEEITNYQKALDNLKSRKDKMVANITTLNTIYEGITSIIKDLKSKLSTQKNVEILVSIKDTRKNADNTIIDAAIEAINSLNSLLIECEKCIDTNSNVTSIQTKLNNIESIDNQITSILDLIGQIPDKLTQEKVNLNRNINVGQPVNLRNLITNILPRYKGNAGDIDNNELTSDAEEILKLLSYRTRELTKEEQELYKNVFLSKDFNSYIHGGNTNEKIDEIWKAIGQSGSAPSENNHIRLEKHWLEAIHDSKTLSYVEKIQVLQYFEEGSVQTTPAIQKINKWLEAMKIASLPSGYAVSAYVFNAGLLASNPLLYGVTALSLLGLSIKGNQGVRWFERLISKKESQVKENNSLLWNAVISCFLAVMGASMVKIDTGSRQTSAPEYTHPTQTQTRSRVSPEQLENIKKIDSNTRNKMLIIEQLTELKKLRALSEKNKQAIIDKRIKEKENELTQLNKSN